MRQPHGQNFLVDNNIANKIVQSANIARNDIVIEVGPGKGALTNILKKFTDNLTAVDIDRELAENMRENYKNDANVTIINRDFLKFDLPEKPFKIVANLPYNVGTAIVQKFLPCKNFVSAVIMLQKDVIVRLASCPGTKDYGYISLFRQYYADAEILFDVPPGCFNPKPQVMSSVIRFTNKNPKSPDSLLFPLVKHCFSMRRKTILNGLSSFLKQDKLSVAEILNNLKMDSSLRPDKLSLEDYLKICNLLKA
ncbi:MAG: 16S rRNA (adenine(1518)-N(6)/adenine(1519)-N(6))-dimethyltransferase RsmA [Endomicrobiaceae bacterium]|nr:16S rRNA (adenine(1518)-N(6)/adenine(1519)-N(6))-dimethyltransferase RsmA [Endomicrobiaceae bacterium]